MRAVEWMISFSFSLTANIKVLTSSRISSSLRSSFSLPSSNKSKNAWRFFIPTSLASFIDISLFSFAACLDSFRSFITWKGGTQWRRWKIWRNLWKKGWKILSAALFSLTKGICKMSSDAKIECFALNYDNNFSFLSIVHRCLHIKWFSKRSKKLFIFSQIDELERKHIFALESMFNENQKGKCSDGKVSFNIAYLLRTCNVMLCNRFILLECLC